MKKRKRQMWQITAVLLIAVMLAGCGGQEDDSQEGASMVVPGKTIDSDSKWINSDIDGAINESTEVVLTDDFHTAVNKEWIVEQTVTKKEPDVNSFSQNNDMVQERAFDILWPEEGGGSADTNNVGLDEEMLKQDEELIHTFVGLTENWEERDQQGVEIARPYIDAIEQIRNIEEMNAYLLNEDGQRFCNVYPVGVKVKAPYIGKAVYTVDISPISDSSDWILGDSDQYMGSVSTESKDLCDTRVHYLLGRLGYSNEEINRILRYAYRFEARMADAITPSTAATTQEAFESVNNIYTIDEIKNLQGNYPLTEFLECYGLGQSESYTVDDPGYVSKVGRFYSEMHLEEIKAYYIVHTTLSILPLLDRDSHDMLQELNKLVSDSSETDEEADEEEEEKERVLRDVSFYLGEPLNQVYIARYCTPEQKEELQNLIDEIVVTYRQMLHSEDWLSEETINGAVEKLDNMCIRVLYPNTFTDYRGLDLEGCNNLADAVAHINAFEMTLIDTDVNQPVDRHKWDLKKTSTMTVNAYYMPSENSINILAGIVADGLFYNSDMEDEELLARIGSVVGHEISHAFDSHGYEFDKNGEPSDWWDPADKEEFQVRVSNLENYYKALTPYPGSGTYKAKVSGEAIADMGGLKCMILLSHDRENFDYGEFFQSYAQLWREKDTYDQEVINATDVHPLSFLRTNVTVQQYDEFLDAFGIEQGDGMYLAPDKRIAVW